jgi:hypothetical protein
MGVYAIPQNDCFKAGFFWKLLGSLGLVPGGTLLDEVLVLVLFFFVRTTPRVTPTAMRTATVNTEPMTWESRESRWRQRGSTDNELGPFVGLLSLLEPVAIARGLQVLVRACGLHEGRFGVTRGLRVSKVWVGNVCCRMEGRRRVDAGLALNGLRSSQRACFEDVVVKVGTREMATSIPTKIFYTIYIFLASEERHAHGVIVITVHLWGGGYCGVRVVTVGWHLAHHVVVVALHFCTLAKRKRVKEGTMMRRRL